MEYEETLLGEFVERPNRFVAVVRINGEAVRVHVKNTGQCNQLLTGGQSLGMDCFSV